jgi:hypothetical protein
MPTTWGSSDEAGTLAEKRRVSIFSDPECVIVPS